MTLSPFKPLPHRLDPRRFPPSPVTDPRRRIIVPHRRPNVLNIGGFQRNPATGGWKRDKTRGGIRRNAWTDTTAGCCCQKPGSNPAGCPCGNGSGGGTLNATLRVTLGGWTMANSGVCASSGAMNLNDPSSPTGTSQIGYSSTLNPNGTYCLNYKGQFQLGLFNPCDNFSTYDTVTACVYAVQIGGGTTNYYPSGSGACTGTPVSVAGAWLFAAISGAIIQVWVGVQAKSGGVLFNPFFDNASDLQYLVDGVAFHGVTGFCNGGAPGTALLCGFSATWTDTVLTVGNSRLYTGTTTVTDAAC